MPIAIASTALGGLPPRRIKDTGFGCVGISLDGIGKHNDLFRGKPGALEAAMRASRNSVAVGQKCGLRLALTRHNYQNLNSTQAAAAT